MRGSTGTMTEKVGEVPGKEVMTDAEDDKDHDKSILFCKLILTLTLSSH
jgi:hypothetical protein